MSERDATDGKPQTIENDATVVERRSTGAPPIDLESGPTASYDTAAATRAREEPGPTTVRPDFDGRTTELAQRTLVRDEILRSRSLGKVGLGLSICVGAVVPFLGASTVGTALMLLVCVAAAGVNLGLIILSRDLDRLRATPLAVIWIVAAVVVAGGISFFGVFSAAPLTAGLGIYFVSLGTSRWLAYAVWAILSALLAAVVIASMAGLIDDPGLITADHLAVHHRALLLVLLEGLLLAVFILGRHSRQATAMAVAELERTTRDLAQREALLDEARQDLQAALGGGGAGPWSGRQLGEYVIGQLLGRGGMGEVYEAISGADRRVAVKVLTPASALDPKIVERFRREAQISSALESEHIIKVFEISEADTAVPYLVMERLDGCDLAELLRKNIVLDETSLVWLVEQIAQGLDVAHAAGVVHRDIKPQNLYADDRSGKRTWKILDFGVSKLLEHSGTLTGGHVVGTPAYMAPEQATGEVDVGAAADTYALAAIAYRCLTGRPPFRGKGAAALLFNVVHQMPVRPSSLVRVPSTVDGALTLGMAKEPAERFSSASEFARTLTAALRGKLSDEHAARARRIERATPWTET